MRLTEAGRYFLEPARQALAAADLAVAAVLDTHRPLWIDVWGHLYAPMRNTLAQVATGEPMQLVGRSPRCCMATSTRPSVASMRRCQPG
ncbi:hypothetical protein AB0L44_39835 [Nonomuraea wenchangensis]|uniref:hypothetical protein n=1 Tax=Nonomuraea wenchangensis TaxID=568860 RepID=UPI00344AA557